MSASDLYPAPEPPDIGLIGFIHESEFAEIREYGGYGWTTLGFDAAMWDALVAAGVIAALPGERLTRGSEKTCDPGEVIPALDRIIPALEGEPRDFAERFRAIAEAANRQWIALDIWVL